MAERSVEGPNGKFADQEGMLKCKWSFEMMLQKFISREICETGTLISWHTPIHHLTLQKMR